MIVFDLKCGQDHVFEAWFGSSGAYAEQREAGMIACPICGDGDIAKAVMAPNVGAKGNRAPVATPAKSPGKGQGAPDPQALIAALAKAQAAMLEGSQWVGTRFADRARAMHDGTEPTAPIHGQATIAEAREMLEEGVPVAPLPLPVVPPEKRN